MRRASRLRVQRRRVPKREAEVVGAATAVFYARGYGAATVQEVADELDINKGSLYHYIQTKEDLLVCIVEQVHEDVEGIIDDVCQLEGLSALERIELYVERQIHYSLDNRQSLTVYHQEMDHLTGVRRDQVIDRRREHNHIVLTLIRDAQSEGSVPDDRDPQMLTNCLFAVITATYRWSRPGGMLDRDTVAAEAARFVMRALT